MLSHNGHVFRLALSRKGTAENRRLTGTLQMSKNQSGTNRRLQGHEIWSSFKNPDKNEQFFLTVISILFFTWLAHAFECKFCEIVPPRVKWYHSSSPLRRAAAALTIVNAPEIWKKKLLAEVLKSQLLLNSQIYFSATSRKGVKNTNTIKNDSI